MIVVEWLDIPLFMFEITYYLFFWCAWDIED